MNRALRSLIYAMNPNSTKEDEVNGTDCCICINAMAPFQALFLAPCSHCFHYKCVTTLLGAGFMFQCPLCRQVANLEASVAEPDDFQKELTNEEDEEESEFVGRGKTLARPPRVGESQESLQHDSDGMPGIEESPSEPDLIEHSAPVTIPGSNIQTVPESVLSPSTPRNYSSMAQNMNRQARSPVPNTSNQLMDSLAQVINSASSHDMESLNTSMEQYNVQLKQILEQAIGDSEIQNALLSRLALNLDGNSSSR
jgi:hypothetical protein